MEQVRIDKWLWAVRLFKSRSMATNACNKGRVMVNETEAKPSRRIGIEDIVKIRKPPAFLIYKVKGLIEKRVSAKIAVENYEDQTPLQEYDKLKSVNQPTQFIFREKGKGRPTKKERRLIDKFKNSQH
jgi:ribosome-associated heat shock protein Hsp15